MAVCFKYAFCTSGGAITQNVFASPGDAEMWASRLSEDNPGTLYIYDGDCWVPDMVFGLPDDDVSVVARGMAFVGAVNGGDYAEELKEYLGCGEIPDTVRESLLKEIDG